MFLLRAHEDYNTSISHIWTMADIEKKDAAIADPVVDKALVVGETSSQLYVQQKRDSRA